MTQKTETWVHSENQLNRQRWHAHAMDRCALCGVCGFAQFIILFPLHLYEAAGASALFSLLITLPYAFLLLLFSRLIAKRTPSGMNPLTAICGNKAGGALGVLFCLLHLFDAQLAFYALCAVIREISPDQSQRPVMLAIALGIAYAVRGDGFLALPRAGRAIKWIAGGMLSACVISALPHGRPEHFFPLLGNGLPSMLQAALWLCGAENFVVWPLLMPQEAESRNQLLAHPRRMIASFAAVCAAAALYTAAAFWLTPFFTLRRSASLGWRLMLITNMTPSIPAWSLELAGFVLLALLGVSFHLSQAVLLIHPVQIEKRRIAALPALFFMLFLMPAALIASPDIQNALIIIAPFRAALPLLLAVILLIGAVRRRLTNRKGGEKS